MVQLLFAWKHKQVPPPGMGNAQHFNFFYKQTNKRLNKSLKRKFKKTRASLFNTNAPVSDSYQ
jgi:hypothetical protein